MAPCCGRMGAATALFLSVAVLAPTGVTASIYSVDLSIPDGTYKNFTEGPIFETHGAPHWLSPNPSPAHIQVRGRFSVSPGSEDATGDARVSIVFSSYDTRAAGDGDGSAFTGCSPVIGKNGVIAVHTEALTNGWGEVDKMVVVSKTGWTYITMAACSGERLATMDLQYQGLITMRNPYGYLPALLFGYLAFFGGMFLLYVVLSLVFAVRCLCMRRHLLRLQLFILGVMLMGVLEAAAWFFTYNEMNTQGEPLCCPVRADITFSIVITIFKKAVSQLLLLAVSLGYGVVKPELPRKTTGLVLLLGLAYLASSLNYYMRRVVATSSGNAEEADAGWNIPVAVCDVTFIFWIYMSLNQVQKSLQASGQFVKLGMYQRLARTLGFFVLLWVLYSIVSIAMNYGAFTLHWTYTYILDGFWDVLYFFLLVAIASIWAPSKRAESYAYSSQIPQDDFDEDGGGGGETGFEMAKVETVGEEFAIGEDDDDEDDDEEVDVDLGVDSTVANV